MSAGVSMTYSASISFLKQRPLPQHVCYDHAPRIAAQDVAFVFCVEATAIETQAIVLARSIRDNAGAYRNAPIYAICPRPQLTPSPSTVAVLDDLDVCVIVKPLNSSDCPYLSINRLAAAAWAEAHLACDYLAVLDTDMAFLSEPVFRRHDVSVRPVDCKGSASRGSTDVFDPYWDYMCSICGIRPDDLPWVQATMDGTRVRAAYNGGFTIARRELGVFARAYAVMLRAIEEGRKPFAGSGLNVFASTGSVGVAASEYWGSVQTALSAAIWSTTRNVALHDDGYNVPLHILAKGKADHATFRRFYRPTLIHYHWLLEPQYRDTLFATLEALHANAASIAWLRRLGGAEQGSALGCAFPQHRNIQNVS